MNLYRSFVFIRNDIKRYRNKELVSFLLDSLKGDFDIEVANSLDIDFLLDDHENSNIIYVPEYLKKALLYALTKLTHLLSDMAYDEAYDLVDAIHVLPELIIHGKLQNLDDFWNTFIKPMRNKWNSIYFQEFEGFFISGLK